MFYEKQDIYICMKEKKVLATSSNQKWREPWKKLFWNEEKHVWNQILHKAIYVNMHKRKLLSPSPGLFFAGTLL